MLITPTTTEKCTIDVEAGDIAGTVMFTITVGTYTFHAVHTAEQSVAFAQKYAAAQLTAFGDIAMAAMRQRTHDK